MRTQTEKWLSIAGLTYGVGGERVILQVLIPLVELLLHSVHERLLWRQTREAGTTFITYGVSIQKNFQHLQSHRVRRPKVAMVSNWLTETSSEINGKNVQFSTKYTRVQ